MTSLVGARVVTPDGVLPDGRVEVDRGVIVAVRAGEPAAAGQPAGGGDPAVADPAVEELGGGWLVPGFVDIHCHGGGGAAYPVGDPAQARAAAAFHLARGTTTTLASLVTAPVEELHAATVALRPLVESGVLAGIHFEGPYLSEVRCGAQDPRYLRLPDDRELADLLDAGAGTVRMVTVAPELPGALDLIRLLTGRGVVAAVGHTDATYEQTLAAVQAGATVATHLFNGMRTPHHRTPGPVFALLGNPDVVCELVADGVHLHDGTLRFAATAAGSGRSALITDAMAAAGMPDGGYLLGEQQVEVSGGVARLSRDGSIAGSTLTMDAAFRRAALAGIPMSEVVRMASTTPAAAVGLTDRGAVAPGLRADFVVLDDELRVRRVMRAGRWIP